KVVELVTTRRGKEHIYDDISPTSTALIVIDMQNSFMPLPGSHMATEMAPKIVPQINELTGVVRETGGTVVWIQTTFTENDEITWSTAHNIASSEWAAGRFAALERGSKGHALFSELDTKPDDLYVEKSRYSAFIAGSSDLDAILRERGIDTLL